MTTIKQLFFSLCTTGILLSLATPAFAARTYLVELAIFTNQNADNSEKWISTEPPFNARKMSRAIFPGEGDLALNQSPAELKDSKFNSYVNRIRNSRGRKVILSTRWVQPVSSPATTAIARISEQKDTGYSIPDNETGNAGGENLTSFVKPLINGFINFYLDAQYTLEADIRYTPPYRPSILDETPDSGPVSYRIYEKRRMKSGELNYYDHPKFGMVLLITPVVTPAE